MQIEDEISEALGVPVTITTRNALHPLMRRRHPGLVMPKDPTIAIRDCLAEIAILHEIEERTTLQAFRSDPIGRRAAT
jgi:hypothetical protein